MNSTYFQRYVLTAMILNACMLPLNDINALTLSFIVDVSKYFNVIGDNNLSYSCGIIITVRLCPLSILCIVVISKFRLKGLFIKPLGADAGTAVRDGNHDSTVGGI